MVLLRNSKREDFYGGGGYSHTPIRWVTTMRSRTMRYVTNKEEESGMICAYSSSTRTTLSCFCCRPKPAGTDACIAPLFLWSRGSRFIPSILASRKHRRQKY